MWFDGVACALRRPPSSRKMKATSFAFDAEEIAAGIATWVGVESPSYGAAAVNRMMDLAADTMRGLGAEVERFPRGIRACPGGFRLQVGDRTADLTNALVQPIIEIDPANRTHLLESLYTVSLLGPPDFRRYWHRH